MSERPDYSPRLLEVLVLGGILLFLATLFLPAINTSRGGRRATCQNNLRNCTLALMMYEEMHRQYPGYANAIGDRRASWVVPILPQIERNDLYHNWTQAGTTASALKFGTPQFYCPIDLLICPSGTIDQANPAPLSFVVNSGSARTANDFLPPIASPASWTEDPNSGVFFNRARADFDRSLKLPAYNPPAASFAPDAAPPMNLKFITDHDGAAYTLMISENLQAGSWATDPRDFSLPFVSEFQIRQSTAMVWFLTGNADNAYPPAAAIAGARLYDSQSMRINGRSDLARPLELSFRPDAAAANAGGLAAARPSATHSGGVNVSYVGGNVGYLSEDIDYRTFTQLMTPNGREVIVDHDSTGNSIPASAPPGTSPNVSTPWLRDLDVNEF